MASLQPFNQELNSFGQVSPYAERSIYSTGAALKAGGGGAQDPGQGLWGEAAWECREEGSCSAKRVDPKAFTRTCRARPFPRCTSLSVAGHKSCTHALFGVGGGIPTHIL
eukprot:365405-Chlamydomonas_euryale.AAC.1